MAEQDQVERYLLDGAQMTLTALIAGTVGFLKEHGLSVDDWTGHLGGLFEDSWAVFEGEGADDVLEHLIPLQLQPLGVEVLSSRGGVQEAEVAVTSLPSRALLEKFGTTPRELLRGVGITQQEFNRVYDMFKPPAKAAGFRFTHSAKRGKHVITVKQRHQTKR